MTKANICKKKFLQNRRRARVCIGMNIQESKLDKFMILGGYETAKQIKRGKFKGQKIKRNFVMKCKAQYTRQYRFMNGKEN